MFIQLINHTMSDGSRQFAALPESCTWPALRKHLGKLDGVVLGEYLTDGVTEAWIDFTYRGYSFTVNNQFGEYWFFSSDAQCPDELLTEIVRHCRIVCRDEHFDPFRAHDGRQSHMGYPCNGKARSRRKRFILILGLLVLLWSAWQGFHYFVPMLTDQTAPVRAMVFLDTDHDGIHDGDDKPLAGVCVWVGITPLSSVAPEGYCDQASSLTGVDTNSMQSSDWQITIEGASCETIHVFALAPDGYTATTPLGSRGCYPQFGFANTGESPQRPDALSSGQYAKQELFSVVLKQGSGLLLMGIIAWVVSYMGVRKPE